MRCDNEVGNAKGRRRTEHEKPRPGSSWLGTSKVGVWNEVIALALSLAGFLFGINGAFAAAARLPNIILIIADDVGYGELGAQGFLGDVPTPSIDSIARQGVRFRHAYAASPLCSPSRVGIVTGRFPARIGHDFNPGRNERKPGSKFGIPAKVETIAEYLKKKGYATGAFGKWHLGYSAGALPMDKGFDEFFGFLSGAQRYFQKRRSSKGERASGIFRGREPVTERRYLTEAFAREAINFLERHRTQPMFLYLSFNACHAPLQAPARYLSRVQDIKDGKRRKFAAVLAGLDLAVGRVLDQVDALGKKNETIVFFLSDNGGPTDVTTSQNGPLRGGKFKLYDGGIMVPFFIRWPGRFPEGRVYEEFVSTLDIFPTIIGASGGGAGELGLDGIDLAPYVVGKAAGAPHKRLFWRVGRSRAVREGQWKWVLENVGTAPALYNLALDPSEAVDVSGRFPQKALELERKLKQWDSEMAPPAWSRGGRENWSSRSRTDGT